MIFSQISFQSIYAEFTVNLDQVRDPTCGRGCREGRRANRSSKKETAEKALKDFVHHNPTWWSIVKSQTTGPNRLRNHEEI